MTFWRTELMCKTDIFENKKVHIEQNGVAELEWFLKY